MIEVWSSLQETHRSLRTPRRAHQRVRELAHEAVDEAAAPAARVLRERAHRDFARRGLARLGGGASGANTTVLSAHGSTQRALSASRNAPKSTLNTEARVSALEAELEGSFTTGLCKVSKKDVSPKVCKLVRHDHSAQKGL